MAVQEALRIDRSPFGATSPVVNELCDDAREYDDGNVGLDYVDCIVVRIGESAPDPLNWLALPRTHFGPFPVLSVHLPGIVVKFTSELTSSSKLETSRRL